MEIKHGSGHPGLNASSDKRADANSNIAPEKANTLQASKASTVTVTDSAIKLLQIEKTLGEMTGFDAEKVESIKQALSDGSYTINTDRIADKLIKFEQDLA